MRKGQKTSDATKLKMSLASKGKKKNYPVWNKGKKIGNKCGGGWFKKGHKLNLGKHPKHKRAWSAEEREANRQGQYRRFEREIPNYRFEDNGRRLRRKVRLLQNGGFHTRNEWETLKAQYNWTCPSCHKAEPEIILTKDHIIAILNGGTDNIENIQPLCRPCNSSKHSKNTRYLGRV
jgi:5-methylcytosine-specific restriction endonuclease McrA